MGNINIHSLILNFYWLIKKNVKLLKKLINSYKLLINKNFDYSICLLDQSIIFIINLAFNSF